MFLLHMAQPIWDIYQDQTVGVVGAEHWGPHEWGTLAHVQFLSL